jgi:GT2 family glycosyltransferase
VIPITIGITTRDRPESLRRCLRSIAEVLGTSHEVLVFDDASDGPAEQQLTGHGRGLQLRILRDERRIGYIAGRNELVRQASHALVLLLDDDTILLEASAVARAIAVLDADATVAAIAFAQAEGDGRPWNERMQPGRWRSPCYVPSYIGFAHLLRRSVFLSLGGYRTDFVFYGEEKDYCLRLLAENYHVVYLPDARIAHVPDAGGRDHRRYVRHVIRNDCLASFYNEPWPLAVVSLPVRLLRFRRMAAGIPGGDPEGLQWILSKLWSARADIRRGRRAVSWSTIREWRRRVRTLVPYQRPSGSA